MIDRTLKFAWVMSMALMVSACDSASVNSGDNPQAPVTQASGVTTFSQWSVSGYSLGPKAELSDKQAQTWLFKPLAIMNDWIEFDGQRCTAVQFNKTEQEAAPYLATRWQIKPADLNITEATLTVVQTNCNLPGFKEYIRSADGRVIVPINGVFFYFESNAVN